MQYGRVEISREQVTSLQRALRGLRSLVAVPLCAATSIGLPLEASADPVEKMVTAIEDCLEQGGNKVGNSAEEFDEHFLCVSTVDLECRSSAADPGSDRYSCWNQELEAWTVVRQKILERLVGETSENESASAEGNGDLVRSLVRADKAWQTDRFADCEYRTLRWRGAQSIVESYTCPIEIEARRAIEYLSWAQAKDNVEVKE